MNGAAWRAAEVPAVNGHGTARGVAGLYAAFLRGELLPAGVLAEATTEQCAGTDAVFGDENAWGLGFGSTGRLRDGRPGRERRVGQHAGGYAFGFVTGSVGDLRPGRAVENALRDCLGLPPLDG